MAVKIEKTLHGGNGWSGKGSPLRNTCGCGRDWTVRIAEQGPCKRYVYVHCVICKSGEFLFETRTVTDPTEW